MTDGQLALTEAEPLVWAVGARSVAVAVARAVRSFQTFDPLNEVVVITPAGPTADTVRSLLPSVADGGGIAGLRFTTVPDLALDLAEPSIRRARPVTALLLSAAVAHELRVDCPPVLAAQARQPATVAAVARAAERLGSLPSGATATVVLEALGATSVVRKAIVQVAWRARTALRSRGLRDEGLTLASATTALARGRAAVAPLVVVVTDVFPPAQARFVAELLRAAPAHVIVATVPSEGDVDRLDQLRALVDVSQPRVVPIGGPAQVVSCPDEDEEAREVVRRVLALVTGQHAVVAPQQVAVLYPPHGGYGRRLRDEMNRAGLAWSGPAPETLASSLAGQVLRTLVDCLVDGADRVRVLRLVSLAPTWTTGRAGPRPVHDWQALCRRLGLVRADDWDRAVDRLHTERHARMARRGDVSAPISRHDDRESVVLGQLVSLAGDLTTRAARLRSAVTWAAVVDLLVSALEAHIGTEAWRDQAWAEAPAWQRRAAVRVERAVRSLGALDELGSSARPDLVGLGALVATLLEAPAPNQGGAGVRLLPLAAGVCLDAQHVFVVGVNEGVLPGSAVDDVLIDRQLPHVAARWVAHRSWQVQRDQRAWHALLAGDASVVATFARTDLRRGGPQHPSAWLADPGHVAPVVVHRSHADGVHLGEPVTVAELLARAPDLAATLVGRSGLRRRAVALRSRLADGPTVFDGCVGPHDHHHPARRSQTITAFERYAACPVNHLMSHVFGVRVEDDAVDVIEVGALDKGSLVHAAFEGVAAEWLALADGERLPWLAGPHLDQVVARAADVLDQLADQLRAENRLGHAAVWRIERQFALDAIRHSLELELADGSRPLAVEHAFGARRAQPSMVVPTSVGPVAFDGRIDRVDQLPGGVVRVTDFKTSNAVKRRSTSRSDPTERGTKLQLPLYARVAVRDFGDAQAAAGTSVSMRYLYLRRGLAEPAELGGDVDAAFADAVERTALAMAQGRFAPAEPDQLYGCPVCSPDGLGLEAVAARAAACRPPELDPVPTEVDRAVASPGAERG